MGKETERLKMEGEPITLITTMTPASENIRGTSALPYHLIKGWNPTTTLPGKEGKMVHSFSIYTFNNNAHFIRHPHYEISQKLKAESGKLEVSFHSPKIRVLIAGRYDLYMKQDGWTFLNIGKNMSQWLQLDAKLS